MNAFFSMTAIVGLLLSIILVRLIITYRDSAKSYALQAKREK